jgi:hypothetical protein
MGVIIGGVLSCERSSVMDATNCVCAASAYTFSTIVNDVPAEPDPVKLSCNPVINRPGVSVTVYWKSSDRVAPGAMAPALNPLHSSPLAPPNVYVFRTGLSPRKLSTEPVSVSVIVPSVMVSPLTISVGNVAIS